MDARARQAFTAHLTRLADGDRAAFTAVFAAAWPLVRDFTRRLAGNADDADDLAQQALLKVFARAGDYDRRRPAIPWVLGIAYNEYRTLRQRRRRRGEAPLLAEAQDPRPSPEESAVRNDAVAVLRGMIADLSPEDAAALHAALTDGDRPRLAAATYRKRVQRALDRLRLRWRTRHGLE